MFDLRKNKDGGTLLEMEGPVSSSPKIVTDPDVGRCLVDSEMQQFLAPFLGRDLTVTEAAQIAGVKLNTMYVKVRRFVRQGILAVRKEQPRRGRAIKYYRTVADRFFVPFEVMGYESVEAMQARVDAYWERELREAIVRSRVDAVGVWGYEIFRTNSGAFRMHSGTSPGIAYRGSAPNNPAVVSLWNENIFLDFPDAKAFQLELYELLNRYRQKRGSQRYLLRIGLAPWSKS